MAIRQPPLAIRKISNRNLVVRPTYESRFVLPNIHRKQRFFYARYLFFPQGPRWFLLFFFSPSYFYCPLLEQYLIVNEAH